MRLSNVQAISSTSLTPARLTYGTAPSTSFRKHYAGPRLSELRMHSMMMSKFTCSISPRKQYVKVAINTAFFVCGTAFFCLHVTVTLNIRVHLLPYSCMSIIYFHHASSSLLSSSSLSFLMHHRCRNCRKPILTIPCGCGARTPSPQETDTSITTFHRSKASFPHSCTTLGSQDTIVRCAGSNATVCGLLTRMAGASHRTSIRSLGLTVSRTPTR